MSDQNSEDLGGANDDVIAGWRFNATLELRTPHIALAHDGELRGVGEPLPEYGPAWAGVWCPETKSWADLGLDEFFQEPDESLILRCSEIGNVSADGGTFLPFLKGYRAVVESAPNETERNVRLREYLARPEFSEIVRQLPGDPAIDLGVDALDEALPIGRVLAERMYRAGFVDVAAVRAASDAQLLAIPGFGSKRLVEVRAAVNTPA